MKADDKITDKTRQYIINKEAAKISELSSGEIDKYEYLKGKEILLSNQSKILEQIKFKYSSLALKKQAKVNMEQGDKLIKTAEEQKKKQMIAKDENGEKILNNVKFLKISLMKDIQK